jgi:glycosyltransferase involved in cell wall biosynthesis
LQPLVSILIPVFNCRQWLSHSIESALEQTWRNCEIIALDDCSTDGSSHALQEWRNCIRVERSANNGGQNVSRNLLTSMSRGTWLCYLDADDELGPTAINEKMKFCFDSDAIYGTMDARHFRGKELVGSRQITAEGYPDAIRAAFEWKYPNTSAFMFRRSALLEVGGWNEKIQNCTDYDLYFRLLLARRRFQAAPDSLTVYRQWSESQAVYENGLRRTSTRLAIMWRSISELEIQQRVTVEIRHAFFNAALSVLRSLYQFDVGRALEEERRLRTWAPAMRPSQQFFPIGFCLGYQFFGFSGAERLARLTRFLRPKATGAFFQPALQQG